jgi:hypothetical protein
MTIINDFFTTWGLGKFEPVIEDDTFGLATCVERFTAKNIFEYIPLMGAVIGCTAISDLINQKPNIPQLSTAAKVGLVVHSVLGILGTGLVCLPFDALASIIRTFRKDNKTPATIQPTIRPQHHPRNFNDVD